MLRASNVAFGAHLTDMLLSGYRAFSREFMKSMPVLSRGFEIETEMTLHALTHDMPIVEVPVPYGLRPEGSTSKLHTLRDGYKVLKTIFWLFKDYRPLVFFGWVGGRALCRRGPRGGSSARVPGVPTRGRRGPRGAVGDRIGRRAAVADHRPYPGHRQPAHAGALQSPYGSDDPPDAAGVVDSACKGGAGAGCRTGGRSVASAW